MSPYSKLSSFRISRRHVLRGVGAALALPWLEAMEPVFGSGLPSRPKRLAVLFMPNGVREDRWTPQQSGPDFELSPILSPLQSKKDQLLVLTNLWNQGSNVGDGHYVKTSGLLTCRTITKSLGVDISCNGVSMDQVAAASVAGQTPLRSLELAMDPINIGVDGNVGYTRVYGSHISWAGPEKPLPRDIDPTVVYRRLFRATRPTSARQKRHDTLLLNRVYEDARDLRKRLGNEDRNRMEDYLASVRSLEKQLDVIHQNESEWRPKLTLGDDSEPASIDGRDHQGRVRVMLDMLALAFQADITRVSSFMFGNAVSQTNFSFLDGVTGGHHDLSHHERKTEKLDQYERVARWHVEQYAYLIDKLGQMQEGQGSLLDQSVVLFASGLRDGNSHNPHNLPVLVAGQGGGRIATGKHLRFDENTPLANLYSSLLSAYGAGDALFADATEQLPGVLRDVAG